MEHIDLSKAAVSAHLAYLLLHVAEAVANRVLTKMLEMMGFQLLGCHATSVSAFCRASAIACRTRSTSASVMGLPCW